MMIFYVATAAGIEPLAIGVEPGHRIECPHPLSQNPGQQSLYLWELTQAVGACAGGACLALPDGYAPWLPRTGLLTSASENTAG